MLRIKDSVEYWLKSNGSDGYHEKCKQIYGGTMNGKANEKSPRNHG